MKTTIPIKINTFNALKSYGNNARNIQQKSKRINETNKKLNEVNKKLIAILERNEHALNISDYLEFKRLTK